jgi:hypothetical protein
LSSSTSLLWQSLTDKTSPMNQAVQSKRCYMTARRYMSRTSRSILAKTMRRRMCT